MLPTPQADPDCIGVDDPDSGESLGTPIIGSPGAGKTIFAALKAVYGTLRGYPQVLLDPTGSLSTSFLHMLLCYLSEFPEGQDDLLWQRICYIPVGAKDAETVTPFPIYYGQEKGQSLREVSERLLRVIRRASPELVTKAPISWPALRRVGLNVGIILASLGFQPTEVENLLLNPLEWERAGRFNEALRRYPDDAAEAVAYFRQQYLPLSRSEKARLISSFLDHVFLFSADPSLRLLFGARSPGIDWEEVLEMLRLTVIFDFSPLTDPETKGFAIQWIFQSLYEHIQGRGRRRFPLALLIDEFAALTHKAAQGANPLSELLDEFMVQYMRSTGFSLRVASNP
jgi:hypothetical protein